MKRIILTALVLLAVACGPSSNSTDGGDPVIPGVPDAGLLPPDATPPDYADAEVCASVKVNVSATIPTMALAIDQSYSMTSSFGWTTRWDAVYQTLMDPSTGVVTKLQATIRFGLDLWTTNNSGSVCPRMTKVAPALNNFSAIDAVYGPASPIGNTPTAESLTVITSDLQATTDPGPKVIVLATDGEPNGCTASSPSQAKAAAISAVQAAYTAGIRTYVIGVSSSVGAQTLQDLANAGIGLPVGGAQNAPVYPAQNPQDIVNAFAAIVGTVTSCNFTLQGHVDPASASKGSVSLDGHVLTYGTDWTVHPDGVTLEVMGAACTTVKSGGNHDIQAEFPCQIVIQ